MRLIGIDEAGRGPVLGPLVMAAVAVTPEQEAELARMGIRDSKKYGAGRAAQSRRLHARPIVEARCVWRIVEFDPATVDRYVAEGRLDDLEREGALRLLDEIGATQEDRILCDGQPIFGRLVDRWPNLIAENKADATHVCVSAASILAKVRRDEAMTEIERRYAPEFGIIEGNGYVNDKTRAFLEAYERAYGELPLEARKSWTWRKKPTVVDGPNIADLLNDI
jgi:ribonuclease HII